ncbi:hypothetical protein PSECIP111951_02475 [Pseudoalteromonas holothuriae]|uniref:HTH LytTR-type domain-containing protein n=2 Tax=Pseudoalteromonas holothuriae TaxID=2963714 RepID=A0ABN8UMF7_9GAMM|nr:hypothetical protein PSECIP111951_02475 [Pseudoalteromonas sp. CIP111951]
MYEWAVFCMNGQFPLGAISPWRYFFFAGFFLACLLSVSDDDNNLPVWLNFFVWQVQVFSCLAFFILTHCLLKGPLGRQNDILKLAISSIIGVTFYAPFSLLIDVYVEYETAYSWNALFEEWQNMVPPALLSWIAINLPWVIGFKLEKTTSTPHSANMAVTKGISHTKSSTELSPNIEQASIQCTKNEEQSGLNHNCDRHSFYQLAQLKSISELIYLKAELHYLKVVTQSQQHLILYNLKDAISDICAAEPSIIDGQTHRSFWVNKEHILSLSKNNREGSLLMSNKDFVPVSRTNMKKVKAWLESKA